jgi:hypothetical protein
LPLQLQNVNKKLKIVKKREKMNKASNFSERGISLPNDQEETIRMQLQIVKKKL